MTQGIFFWKICGNHADIFFKPYFATMYYNHNMAATTQGNSENFEIKKT